MGRSFLFLVIIFFSLLSSALQYKKITINNQLSRRDINFQILDAHDGALHFFNGRYYLYGTRYGNTDGWGKTNRFVVYSSPNLVTWFYEGELLNKFSERVYFRPYVIYNSSSKKYVLWFNVDDHHAVATSDKPQGPFTLINDNVVLAKKNVGDLGLFVDTDGSAYVTYTFGLGGDFYAQKEPIPHHQIMVEKLSKDYLSSSGESVGPIAGNCESPTLFKRKNLYYLLFDNTCSFCSNGTGVRVYISKKALGPYEYRGNINITAPKARHLASPWTMPGQGRTDAIIKAQQTHVAVLPGRKDKIYLWMGDRWGSRPDGLKGHDFQNWAPLSFESDGMIKQLENKAEWNLEIQAQ